VNSGEFKSLAWRGGILCAVAVGFGILLPEHRDDSAPAEAEEMLATKNRTLVGGGEWIESEESGKNGRPSTGETDDGWVEEATDRLNKQQAENNAADKKAKAAAAAARKAAAEKAVQSSLAALSPTVANRYKGLRRALIAEALKLAQGSPQPWLDLLRVAALQKRFGDTEGAQQTFELAARLAVKPGDANATGKAMTDVVKGMVRSGFLDEAVTLAARIQSQSWAGQAYSQISVALAARGEFTTARGMAFQVTDMRARDKALMGIATYEARLIGLAEAMQTAVLISNSSYQGQALSRVAITRAAMGDLVGANAAIEAIGSARMRDYARYQLAEYQTKSGSLASARQILPLINDVTARDSVLRQIAELQALRDDVTAAGNTALQINDVLEQSLALEAIAGALAQRGHLGTAVGQAQLIVDGEIRNRTLSALAGLEAYRGEERTALWVVDLINEPLARAKALREVAVSRARQGDFSSAFNLAQEIADAEQRVIALSLLAREQGRIGDLSGASESLQSAEGDLGLVENLRRSDQLLGQLAVAHAYAGDPRQALEKVNGIDQATQRDIGSPRNRRWPSTGKRPA
jgi:hypothetical protein